jgi:hypothetical protein
LLGDSLTSVDIQCTKFGFRAEDMMALMSWVRLRTVPLSSGLAVLVDMKKVSTGAAACFGFAQIGRIAVHDEHHVTPPVSDDGVLVCSGVVKELLPLCHGVLDGF